MARPNKDHIHLRRLRDIYARFGCLPSYGELAKALGFRAKNSAYKLTQRLIDAGHLTKSLGGRIAPGSSFFTLELGDDEVRAGFGAEGNATGLFQAQALDTLLVGKPSKTTLVKLRGESMTEAGIFSGDLVVVEANAQAVPGDIVIAEADGGHTIKEIRTHQGRQRLVAHGIGTPYLDPKESLQILGVVRGVIRSFKPSALGNVKLSKRGLAT